MEGHVTGEAVGLLCGFLIAHYLGDFTPLATARMQEAKADAGPVLIIAGHAGVHALLAAAVVILVSGSVWPSAAIAAAVVLVTHFALDASRSMLGRRFPALNDPGDSAFWYLLGVDQLAHGLVLVAVAALIL